MSEVRLEELDKWYDAAMEGIDVSANDKSEANSVSMTQILDSYEESKEQY